MPPARWVLTAVALLAGLSGCGSDLATFAPKGAAYGSLAAGRPAVLKVSSSGRRIARFSVFSVERCTHGVETAGPINVANRPFKSEGSTDQVGSYTRPAGGGYTTTVRWRLRLDVAEQVATGRFHATRTERGPRGQVAYTCHADFDLLLRRDHLLAGFAGDEPLVLTTDDAGERITGVRGVADTRCDDGTSDQRAFSAAAAAPLRSGRLSFTAHGTGKTPRGNLFAVTAALQGQAASDHPGRGTIRLGTVYTTPAGKRLASCAARARGWTLYR